MAAARSRRAESGEPAARAEVRCIISGTAGRQAGRRV